MAILWETEPDSRVKTRDRPIIHLSAKLIFFQDCPDTKDCDYPATVKLMESSKPEFKFFRFADKSGEACP